MQDAGSIGDPRFFRRAGPHGLKAIAEAVGIPLPADADPGRQVLAVAPLQTAGADEISFIDNRRYISALAETRAGIVIVHPDLAARVPASAIPLVTPEPYLAWARVCALFHPLPPVTAGIHAAAVIDPAATVDPSADIGPFVHVGPGASVGPRTRLAPHAVIGPGVTIGADCHIGAHVTLSHAVLGSRVTIFPGARIGQDGFGFATSRGQHISVPQLGRVLIDDDVSIGANTTIDRGSAQDTVIGPGCRIDNLVQIGHNVQLGRGCVVVALVGIAGSVVLEDYVTVAGQAGIAGHLRLGRGSRIGAQSGVMTNVPAGADFVGSPAGPARDVMREVLWLKKMAARPTGKTGTE